MRRRKTLRQAVEFKGVGLHSGKACEVRVFPVEGRGVWVALPETMALLSDARIQKDQRMTGVVFADGTSIFTPEHLLAALFGLELDGIAIAVDGGEIPILDGSAAPFVEAFVAEGIVECDDFADEAYLPTPIEVRSPDASRCLVALPSDVFRVTYVIDYVGTPVGVQRVHLEVSADTYRSEIAGARTFGLTKELEFLAREGLAKGGSLENALVFDERGLVNEGGFRFPDECVRHKVNDLLGDLALVGRRVVAHYVAVCAGHDLHGRLAQRLKGLLGVASFWAVD